MSEHHVEVDWRRGDREFSYETYSRDHVWRFRNGVEVEATSAPEVLGSGTRVDPELAFVAALSSCHMLTFLAIAARRGIGVESYRDRAVGHLDEDRDGKRSIARVVLRPVVRFSEPPADTLLVELHHEAHTQCFIANSVTTDVLIDSTGN